MMTKEEFYNLLSNPDNLNDGSLVRLKELSKEYPFFQTVWFLYLKNLKAVDSGEYQNLLKKAALCVPDRKQLYNFLNKESGLLVKEQIAEPSKHEFFEYGLDDNEDNEQSDSLIDKFLSSGTSAIRIKNKTPDDVTENTDDEIIEKSINENDEIITETLAMIYFEQKKYDKALEAFKKLSLKYPEKSIYFATRIAEIEQLKNI